MLVWGTWTRWGRRGVGAPPSATWPQWPPSTEVDARTRARVRMCVGVAGQECYIEEDMSCLADVARAIMALQRDFGVIPNVKAKGVLAKVCSPPVVARRAVRCVRPAA